MANILMMAPIGIASLVASSGTGSANLLRPEPKEVWAAGDVGTPVNIDIDFGQPVLIDTIALISITSAGPDATWGIMGGLNGYIEQVIQANGPLRVPERAGRASPLSHAFWHGAKAYVRYVRMTLIQPSGNAPMMIGAAIAGNAFIPEWNQDWGAGRGVKDTGTATRLPSGSLSVVEGARYGTYKWTLGNLSVDEADYLYELQLDRGETRRVLVVEDPAQTPGLRNRIHYGLLTGIKPFERRNPAQTTWDFTVEDWVTEGDALANLIPATAPS